MTESKDTRAGRRERVRKALKKHGLDALLVTHAANRYYLSGFELHDPQCNESAGMLLITAKGTDWLITDSRYVEAAEKLWSKENIFVHSPSKTAQLKKFLRDKCSGTLGFEPEALSVAQHTKLSQDQDMKPISGLVESLRLFKDESEIKAMRRSCKVNHKVFERIEPKLIPGVTEKTLAWETEKLFRTLGASELAFPSIVAVDGNAAMPHAIPGETKITDGCLALLDLGGRVDNYCSDQTRTFWVGNKPTDRFKRTLDQVKTAQAKAIAAIRPGISIKEAALEALKYLEKHGVAKHFTHGLGHGVGLETHEAPRFNHKARGNFKPGMVVTAEPGLYFPGWGGVRWEHMVLVTEDGCEVL
ncbi:MAG: Xaa-Pro peptidase family protein [Thermodesulfobacteriota bacterium]|nr:Xaa-Pro peptidase family protein [Thermodesulfobacteriota bacterium]